MERLIERCCGLDVHKKTVTACVRVPGANGAREQHVRTFGTTVADLLSPRDSRLLHRLYVYGLVAQIPRSRRGRVTAFGHRIMGASVRLRQLHFSASYAEAA